MASIRYDFDTSDQAKEFENAVYYNISSSCVSRSSWTVWIETDKVPSDKADAIGKLVAIYGGHAS
jgi:hypothetical protein